MTKKAYRVRNWAEYNKSLVHRGNVTFWFDEKSIQQWYAKPSKNLSKGRPAKYSNTAILAMLILKQVYRLNLRSCQGFVTSIIKMIGLPLDVPSYTQLCRRQAKVKLPKLPVQTKPIHLVIDSSGLKVFGEGEWKVRAHGYSKRRTWRKLHIGIDESSSLIVSAELTSNSCGDDKELPNLLNSYPGELSQVSADGAYDSHDCFNAINQRGAIATIPIQPNPKHKLKQLNDLKKPRDWVAWRCQQQGRRQWKKESGYHRRSLVENSFYRIKQLLGGKLAARLMLQQQREALIKCHILNKITTLGMPQSICIG